MVFMSLQKPPLFLKMERLDFWKHVSHRVFKKISCSRLLTDGEKSEKKYIWLQSQQTFFEQKNADNSGERNDDNR